MLSEAKHLVVVGHHSVHDQSISILL